MEISDIIASIAVLIAGIAMVFQFFGNRKANSIQEEVTSLQREQVNLQRRVVVQDEQRELESKRAKLTSSLCSEKPKSIELSIKNLSQNVEARNIQCLFDRLHAGPPDSPRAPKSLKLLPGEGIRTWYGLPGGERPKLIEVIWEDESGEFGKYDFEI